jgi:predicted nucleic acid-binding protein
VGRSRMSERSPYFLDANVPIYAAGGEHPYREHCARIIVAAARGDIDAVTDTEVIQEIAYRFHSVGRRTLGLQVAEEFLDVVTAVLPVTRADTARALALLRAHDFLLPRDAIHAAVIGAAGLHTILTADRHFDRIPGITRIDPSELAL